MRMLTGLGAGTSYGVHSANLKNLVRGITERVLYVVKGTGLGKAPRPVDGVFDRLGCVRAKIVACLLPTTTVPRRDYPGLYSGRKRVIYEEAVASLCRKAVHKMDAIVNTFVKAEKVNFSAKPDPAPRVIQPRTARYNVEVGRRLKLFESNLLGSFERAYGYPVVLKGKNAGEVAEAIHDSWRRYKKPVAVGLDASRFDQHVSRRALEWEHAVYMEGFPGDKQLERLLGWQLVNEGRAYVGDSRVTYTVEGCRMSGDINTGMGNCLIMSSIVLAYFQRHGIDARLANNGDDCVVICSTFDLHKLAGLDQWFLDFGFTLTREDPVHTFEQIEFCQAHPVWSGLGWRMTRNPWTAMDKDSVSLLSWATDLEYREWQHAISSCGLQLAGDMPIWNEFYRAIGRGGVASTRADDIVRDCGMGRMAAGLEPGDSVGDDTRISFWRAFGILPDDQLAAEAELRSTRIMTPAQVLADTKPNERAETLLSRWRKARR